jgi:hypothetical protein
MKQGLHQRSRNLVPGVARPHDASQSKNLGGIVGQRTNGYHLGRQPRATHLPCPLPKRLGRRASIFNGGRDARVAVIRYMRSSPVEWAGMRASSPAGTSQGWPWAREPRSRAGRCGCGSLPEPSRKPMPTLGGCPGDCRCRPARASPGPSCRPCGCPSTSPPAAPTPTSGGRRAGLAPPCPVRAGLDLVAAAASGHSGTAAQSTTAGGTAVPAQQRVLGTGDQIPDRGR